MCEKEQPGGHVEITEDGTGAAGHYQMEHWPAVEPGDGAPEVDGSGPSK